METELVRRPGERVHTERSVGKQLVIVQEVDGMVEWAGFQRHSETYLRFWISVDIRLLWVMKS